MEQQTIKDWSEVGLSNDFMFSKVMSDPRLCIHMLEIILNIKIDRIEYLQTQKTIDLDKEGKGIRLDIYVHDENGTVYDCEVQTSNTGELPKRSRYYQSMLDMALLDKGTPYSKLKQSFVIFICTFDVFKANRSYYTFENICLQDHDISLGDETTKIFLNTEGTPDGISSDLKAFLDLIGGRHSDNSFVTEIEAALDRARQNREWRHQYMTLEMRYLDKLEEGKQLGIQLGMEQGIQQGIQKGMQQGIQQGMQQGIQQGMQQGMEKGVKKGIAEQKKETALEMHHQGFTNAQILSVLHVTDDELTQWGIL